jgi:hypothetical protein
MGNVFEVKFQNLFWVKTNIIMRNLFVQYKPLIFCYHVLKSCHFLLWQLTFDISTFPYKSYLNQHFPVILTDLITIIIMKTSVINICILNFITMFYDPVTLTAQRFLIFFNQIDIFWSKIILSG